MLSNSVFRLKQFSVEIFEGVFPVTTDSILLGSWVRVADSLRILDIGTGSGLLSLMAIQRAVSNAEIYAIDSSLACIECSKYNFLSSPWADRLHAFKLDALDILKPSDFFLLDATFDVIISNPPYFINALKSDLPDKSRSRHQQELDFELLARLTAKHLNVNGSASFIIPINVEETLSNVMMSCQLFVSRLCRVRDHAQAPVKLCLVEYKKIHELPEIENIILFNEDGNRSNEYHNITKAYYI